MKIILYTLPTCGICNVIKTKLQQKNIDFIEENFEQISSIINSDHAPALQIIENDKTITYNSPLEIISWINQL